MTLFHEYFGHGLFCEQSLAGRKLVDLEKKLLEEEKREFSLRKFTLEELKEFRNQSWTFQELDEHRRRNLAQYELFAIWTEHLLSGEHGLENEFEKKYDSFGKEDREVIDGAINFNKQYGDLAAFYEFDLARRTTPERVKRLLEAIYGEKNINQSKLVLLTGSKKPFSDIDLFASSNYLQPIKNSWLDLVVFDEEDFERRIKLFEVQVTHPIMKGDLVSGDLNYLRQKRRQLQCQSITEEAIRHNLQRAEVNRNFAENSKDETERRISLFYSKSYLNNAEHLKRRSRKGLIYSQSENFIQMKGGIN